MKSLIKRSLFVGISLALVALTARRLKQDPEITGDLDRSGEPDKLDHVDKPSLGAANMAGPSAPTPARTSSQGMVAPTVTFSGTLVRNGPQFALRETAGVLYPLDSAGRAWSYEGEDVRVTGKLDLDTRLLYVDAIEPVAL
jgi:hypothetical protein